MGEMGIRDPGMEKEAIRIRNRGLVRIGGARLIRVEIMPMGTSTHRFVIA